MPTCEPFSTH